MRSLQTSEVSDNHINKSIQELRKLRLSVHEVALSLGIEHPAIQLSLITEVYQPTQGLDELDLPNFSDHE